MTIHGEVCSSRAVTWASRRMQASFSGMTLRVRMRRSRGPDLETHFPADLEGTKGADLVSPPHHTEELAPCGRQKQKEILALAQNYQLL